MKILRWFFPASALLQLVLCYFQWQTGDWFWVWWDIGFVVYNAFFTWFHFRRKPRA